jgi:hypothetical protein
MSEDVAFVVPLIKMETPGMGNPFSSITFPFMETSCACP